MLLPYLSQLPLKEVHAGIQVRQRIYVLEAFGTHQHICKKA